jgi:hypothetical protein
VIKRFNFYDIYGYLLPGVTALGLFWLSYSLNALQAIPELSLGSVLVGIAASYVVGQVLQTVAKQVLPSECRIDGEDRLPSDFILDIDNQTFPKGLRTRLRTRIDAAFGLNIDSRSERGQAFFLCRDLLVQKNLGSYAEQFQGMYALMRGVAIACLLALAYQIGSVLAALVEKGWVRAAALGGAALVTIWAGLTRNPGKSKRQRLRFAGFLALAPLFVGVGTTPMCMVESHWTRLVVLIAMTFFVGCRAYQAGPTFAKKFAETVYRCFVMVESSGVTTASTAGDKDGLDLHDDL